MEKDHLRRIARRPSSPYVLGFVLVIAAVLGGISVSNNLVPTADAEIVGASQEVPLASRE